VSYSVSFPYARHRPFYPGQKRPQTFAAHDDISISLSLLTVGNNRLLADSVVGLSIYRCLKASALKIGLGLWRKFCYARAVMTTPAAILPLLKRLIFFANVRMLSGPSCHPIKTVLRLILCFSMAIWICLVAGGCRAWNLRGNQQNASLYEQIPNPVSVAACERHFVMDQVSDEIDNYFDIRREERLRLVDNVLTEGWIETHPKIASGIFEPWRKDSLPGFEKRLATLQTFRRWAKVRVIPDGIGYSIDVKVYKEMEDRDPPDHSVVTGAMGRHDNALDSLSNDQPSLGIQESSKLIWFPIGRDIQLEQQILRNVTTRLKKK